MTTLVIDINAYIMLKKITKSEPVYAYKYHAYIKTKTKNKKNMFFFFFGFNFSNPASLLE